MDATNNKQNNEENKDSNDKPTKIDPVTALQDTIDGLSLSLFEALRGLRDAVAPESAVGQQQPDGAAAGAAAPPQPGPNRTADFEPDYDEFLLAFYNDDPGALAFVEKYGGGIPPRSREEYCKLVAKADFEKDSELVSRLTEEVLSKSAEVDDLVETLPGMDRTKEDQMKRIQELLRLNHQAARELEEGYRQAEERRQQVRELLHKVTCPSLGIEQSDL